jgi:hypothetical protein
LWALLIPFVSRFVKSAAYRYTIYFLVGLSFAVYNIFGCGNHYSIAVILWFILIVNLAFVLMNHKIALLFGLIVATLLIFQEHPRVVFVAGSCKNRRPSLCRSVYLGGDRGSPCAPCRLPGGRQSGDAG